MTLSSGEAADTAPSRVFVDTTYTICSGKNSGIERVVRSIVRECQNVCVTRTNETPELTIAESGHFYRIGPLQQALLDRSAAMHRNVVAQMPGSYRWLAQSLCRFTQSKQVRKWFMPEAGHLGAFKVPHSLYELFVRKRVALNQSPIVPGPGDLYLLPDAYWARMQVWPAAHQARQNGAMIATIIYDLIPLTHPEYVGLRRQQAFLRYLQQAVIHSDLLIAISKTVADQIRSFIPQLSQQPSICSDIRSFQLGAELKSTPECSVRSDLQNLFGSRNESPYMMVATFDPRKNHRYLLDAFDILWQRQPAVKLCLIGRVGWLCDDIIQRIKSHPRLGQQLFAFHDVSDAELQFCYQASRGVIFPSIVEGFGLPIVESLWHGKKTFASDTPIHREVGANDCEYFDLETPHSLAKQIEQWEQSDSFQKSLLPIRQPIDWKESSRQLIAHCLHAYRHRIDSHVASRAA